MSEDLMVQVCDTILYADTDATGIMYFGSACRFIEKSVHEFFVTNDLTLGVSADAHNIIWVMREVNLLYSKSLRFGEKISIEIRLKSILRYSLHFSIVIKNKFAEIAIKSTVRMACVHRHEHKSCAIPKPLFDKFLEVVQP